MLSPPNSPAPPDLQPPQIPPISQNQDPSPAWKIICAILVLGFVVALCGFISWRSAPPQVPHVAIPGSL